MMTVESAKIWMEENLANNWVTERFADGVASDGKEWVEMTLYKPTWSGELCVTCWVEDEYFEIIGSPTYARCMEETNKTAVIREVENRIAEFDDYAEAEAEDMEANTISEFNREYGSMAVAW